jgi:hypothetical protein
VSEVSVYVSPFNEAIVEILISTGHGFIGGAIIGGLLSQHLNPVIAFTFDRRLSALLFEVLTAPTPLPEI